MIGIFGQQQKQQPNMNYLKNIFDGPADGKVAAGLFVHDKLSESVGSCTAAFARCMLAGQTSPGVWYPEERGALSDRRALLAMAKEGTSRFLLNKPPWAIESEPVQLGLGFYW